jgi:anti-sigma regulatory factor (Ser/Thr protein kinase)
MFITLFMACIDMGAGTMEYCNGGHPPALYYRVASKETTGLRPGGPLVGQFAGIEYRSSRIKISRGDRIFCFTDGFVEAENRQGELYGQKRLEEFFKAGVEFDARKFSRLAREEVERYRQGSRSEAIDDFTTLVIDFVDDEENHSYEFAYPSREEILDELYVDLDKIFQSHRVKADVSNPFRVAVSEAVTNAMVHAHKRDDAKQIHVLVELNQRIIAADIVDEGKCQEIDAIKARNLLFDPAAESGRGLGLIKRLSDEADIRLTPHGGLCIRLVKYLNRDKA